MTSGWLWFGAGLLLGPTFWKVLIEVLCLLEFFSDWRTWRRQQRWLGTHDYL